ncbi:MAG: hypothetical protein OXE52_08220 [Chloroflexi bacterium]|nr:hypothetical protein [Chloroflexota bacterium]
MEGNSVVSIDIIILALIILVSFRWLEWRIDRRSAGFQRKSKRKRREFSSEGYGVKSDVRYELRGDIMRVEAKVDDARRATSTHRRKT